MIHSSSLAEDRLELGQDAYESRYREPDCRCDQASPGSIAAFMDTPQRIPFLECIVPKDSVQLFTISH